MKKSFFLMLTALLALSLTTGCKNEAPKTAEKAPAPAAAPAAGQPAMPEGHPATATGGYTGKVTETMDAAGYTYVQVDTGTAKVWAAAPQFKVAVGDAVVIPNGTAMANYHSKTLNRDFELVYFVDSVMVGGDAAALPASAPAGAPGAVADGATLPTGHPVVGSEPAAQVDLKGIKKADKTVADVFAGKAELSGKEVALRGKVVKFSAQIMGKNWIHVQDGTGDAGKATNDLTVTTDITAKVGDTVLVKGKVSTDKDFGYGYKYDVIIEDAKVTVE